MIRRKHISRSNKALLYAIEKGFYIDSLGNVISFTGKQRKVNYDKFGYPQISISYNKKIVNIYVHKIVAYKKYGYELFKSGICVRHKNGNKLDYSVDNILIGTHSDNMMDVSKELRIKKAKNAASKLRKFTEGEIVELKKMNNYGISYKRLAKAYKTCKSTLSYIMQNKTYK